LAAVLLSLGCKQFRVSLQREALKARVTEPALITLPTPQEINSIDAPKPF
jgi:hypothetical protein